MITLFDERDLVSFGMYMISDQRKDSIKNNPEITNNETRKAILKTVTQFDFNNWLALKLKDDRETINISQEPENISDDSALESESPSEHYSDDPEDLFSNPEE